MRAALLLIAHGSRRAEANSELVDIAQELRKRNGDRIVQVAYLELATPTIAEAGAACVAAGALEVILLPYFLSPGKHVVEDLAKACKDLTVLHPNVRFHLAEPLGSHPLILDALEDRARLAR